MPNRRRRRLSTAISAVAALAVASPFAYVACCQLAADTKPAPEHHEFVRAAVTSDLPGELMNALSQGLSQFGINLPPVPSLSGSSTVSPGLAGSGFTSPGLAAPGLTPGLASPGLAAGLTPGLATPGVTPGLAAPGLTPGLTTPGATPGTLTDPSLTNPALTSPAGVDPALMSPDGAMPMGLDPGADGTYPILGDPSLGAAPAASSGGVVNDLMSAANQLGASQAIDLIKGLVMPSITQAMQGAAQGGAAAPAAALPMLPVPGA